MKIITFNINGVRARLHQLEALVARYQPEIIGLQETKVQDSEFPLQAIQSLGYHAVYNGQKGHYGVALLSLVEPEAVQSGFAWDEPDAQCRLIEAQYSGPNGRYRVINGYFPQGESRDHPTKFPGKTRFYEDLQRYLQASCSPDEPLLVMGDFNIAARDADIGIGEVNARRWLRSGKCSFLPEERAWFERLQSWGLADTWRHHYPDVVDRFSWFDYRSRGFNDQPRRGLRIDGILATRPLLACCRDAGIDYDIRSMERPSDHCPVWAEFGPV
ncbi:MAG: exodeoxyribonuclease III [Gammaproteobacteria bacterium]|nr:exodeoxyribonuclease III [Gammaproteobacteria bacterium]